MQEYRTRATVGLLLFLTLALHLPFIGQAFHMDDVQNLDVAANVYRNPLFPLDMPVIFDGLRYHFWGNSHPPLNPYFIALVSLANGGEPSELLLHSAYLVFPLLAAIAFYVLAGRFVRHALLAAVLLATNPTLMVSAHTLMSDVPLLAMWVCAAALFVRGIDKDRRAELYAAAVPMTAACFYAYQAFAVIPLLAFHALRRKRLGPREALVLIAPIAVAWAWQLSGYLYMGTTYLGAMFFYLGPYDILETPTKLRTALATVTYLGGAIFLFPFIFVKMGLQWRGLLGGLGIAAGIALADGRFGNYTLTEKLFFAFCFGGGLVVIAWAAVRAARALRVERWSGDDVFLTLWFLGGIALSIVAFFSGSARYVLPALPPLLLLLLRSDEGKGRSLNRIYYGGLIAVQVVLGYSLAISDYQFAGIGRQQAREFQSEYLKDQETFLFSGEWGLRHYLSSIGGRIVTNDTVGKPGQLFVMSRLSMGRKLDNELGRSLELIERKTYRIRSPIRLLQIAGDESRPGFWSDGWGLLPFWFSDEDLDEFSVYRVREK